jgi:hypothetical protein
MSKHTPGPWHYFETEDGRCRVKPLNGKYIVAECSAMEPQCEEQGSNARLIAAAPDLLEALRRLLDSGDVRDAAEKGALAAARAAIAKAEGPK